MSTLNLPESILILRSSTTAEHEKCSTNLNELYGITHELSVPGGIRQLMDTEHELYNPKFFLKMVAHFVVQHKITHVIVMGYSKYSEKEEKENENCKSENRKVFLLLTKAKEDINNYLKASFLKKPLILLFRCTGEDMEPVDDESDDYNDFVLGQSRKLVQPPSKIIRETVSY